MKCTQCNKGLNPLDSVFNGLYEDTVDDLCIRCAYSDEKTNVEIDNKEVNNVNS